MLTRVGLGGPSRVLLLAGLLLSPPQVRASDRDPKCVTDDHYMRIVETDGLELSVRRFCGAYVTDSKTQVCAKIVNKSGRPRDFTVEYVVRCEDGREVRAKNDFWYHYDLKPGGVAGGGGYLVNAECFDTCGPRVLPVWYGWIITDNEQQEARRKLEEEERAQAEAAAAEARRAEAEQREEEERRREEATRIAAEREREEKNRRLEAERTAEKARLAEEIRVAEERRRAEEERLRKERERQARAEHYKTTYAEQKKQWDGTHKQVADFMATNEGVGVFAKGLTSSLHLRVGMGLGSAPVYEDQFTAGVFEESEAARGFGLGTYFRLDLYPLFGRYLGVGAYGEAVLGGMAGPDFSTTFVGFAYGARGFVGRDDAFAIDFDMGRSRRSASTSMYIYLTDSELAGSGEAQYRVLGVGAHVCFEAKDEKCEELLYFRAAQETPDDEGDPFWSYRLGFAIRGSMELFGEVSPGVPLLGSPTAPIAAEPAVAFQAGFNLAWDLFGAW